MGYSTYHSTHRSTRLLIPIAGTERTCPCHNVRTTHLIFRMLKKIAFASVGLLLLTAPLLSLALSACPTITLTLYRKPASATTIAQKTQITSLQNFLIAEGYLEAGNNTGNFGALTEAAVGDWQIAHNVLPESADGDSDAGWGVVGPLTRAAITANCGTGGTSTDTTSTSGTPTATLTTNGAASASVDPSGHISNVWSSTNANSFSSRYTATGCSNPAMNTSGSPWYATSANGTSGGSAAPWAGCTTTITFTATNTTTGRSATKTVTNYVSPAPQTNAASYELRVSYQSNNAVVLNSTIFVGSGEACASSYSVDFGDGTALQTKSAIAAYCNSASADWSHTYATAGTYTAKLLKGSQVLATKTITATLPVTNTTTNTPSSTASVDLKVTTPTQTNTNGPATLALGQSLTWSWTSQDVSGTCTFSWTGTTSGSLSKSSTGTLTTSPSPTGSYVMTMACPTSGGIVSDSVNLTVTPVAATVTNTTSSTPSVDLKVTTPTQTNTNGPATLALGQQLTWSWTSQNVPGTCTFSWTGTTSGSLSEPSSGNLTTSPSPAGSYVMTMTCPTSSGNVSDSVNLTVTGAQANAGSISNLASALSALQAALEALLQN